MTVTAKEVVEDLKLSTYEYCNKNKIIRSKEAEQAAKLNEIMQLSAALDAEQISYRIDAESNFVDLFDHKI